MKRKLNKVLCIFFALLVCCLCGVSAFAAEPISVKIDVETKLNGSVPKTSEDYVFVLKSSETGKEITCTVNGEGKGTFEGLTFNKVGVYNFVVTQQKGSNTDCVYDDTVYYLTVTVFYNENSYDFDIAAIVYKDGVDEKQDSIIFENTYKEVVTEETTTEKVTEETTIESTTEKVTEKTQPSSEKEATTEDTDNPYTGDNSKMTMWLSLFGVGVVLVVGAFIVLVNKKKDFEEIN